MNIIRLIIYGIILGILVLFFNNFGFSLHTATRYIQYAALGTLVILMLDELGKS